MYAAGGLLGCSGVLLLSLCLVAYVVLSLMLGFVFDLAGCWSEQQLWFSLGLLFWRLVLLWLIAVKVAALKVVSRATACSVLFMPQLD